MKELLTYAYDDSGKLVNIDEVANGRACNCTCPNCGGALDAKNGGKIKKHHFAHSSGIECEGAHETMLHILAKEKIREAFLKNDVFKIHFHYHSYCAEYPKCNKKTYDCYMFDSSEREYNLKDYYNSCEPEIGYDNINRRSDLKIYSSSHPNREPIYIEFFVTHACDEKKLHEGGKIIELKIESVDDIEKIAKVGFVNNNPDCPEYPNGNVRANFYGFKDEDYTANIEIDIPICRYALSHSGKFTVSHELTGCRHIKKIKEDSVLEICFYGIRYSMPVLDMCKYVGYKKCDIANCRICVNYVKKYRDDYYICSLFKHINGSNEKGMDTAKASVCRYFRVDQEKMARAIADFNAIDPENYTILE